MGILDDFVSSAKTVGDTIGEKTKNLALISGKKLKLVELESKLEKLFAELGKKCFEDYGDDCCDESMKDAVAGIQNLLIDIENIKADIDLLSNK